MEQPHREQTWPFERFSESSNLVLFYARAALSEHGGLRVDPAHLLLGLLKADAAAVAAVLTPAPASQVVSECVVEVIAGPGLLGDDIEVPFGPATSSILASADAVAAEYRHETITPEHLLLALLTQADEPAVACLRAAGVNTARTVEALRRRLRGHGENAVNRRE